MVWVIQVLLISCYDLRIQLFLVTELTVPLGPFSVHLYLVLVKCMLLIPYLAFLLDSALHLVPDLSFGHYLHFHDMFVKVMQPLLVQMTS